MPTTQQNATISTSIQQTPAGYRVRFSMPDGGYSRDELDALAVALDIARRQLAELPEQSGPALLQSHAALQAVALCPGGT